MRKLMLSLCMFGLLTPMGSFAHDVGCTPTTAETLNRAKLPAAVVEEKPGPTASVLPGALLRGSPTLTTPDAQKLPDGTIVMLKAPFKNNDGAWWYVGVKGVGAGWLRGSELTDFVR